MIRARAAGTTGWVSEQIADFGRGPNWRAHRSPLCGWSKDNEQLVPIRVAEGRFWPRRAHSSVPVAWCEHCLEPEAPGDWALRAACRGAPQDWFFAEPGHGGWSYQGRSLCAKCPVFADCEQYALRTRPAYGLWAGRTAKQWKNHPDDDMLPVRCAAVTVETAGKGNR